MERAYTAFDLLEAQSLADYLNDNGVRSAVFGASLSAAVGDLPASGIFPSVHVASEQLDAAGSLIREWRRVQHPRRCPHCDSDPGGRADLRCAACGAEIAAPPPPWTCGTCGEVHEGRFSSCWKCGHQRS